VQGKGKGHKDWPEQRVVLAKLLSHTQPDHLLLLRRMKEKTARWLSKNHWSTFHSKPFIDIFGPPAVTKKTLVVVKCVAPRMRSITFNVRGVITLRIRCH
jgi:hypothetical protein